METVLADADFPVAMAWAPDGRLFFNELMSGKIRILQDGKLVPEPFAELSVGTLGEKGLLGLALHHEFESNGYVYVCYTRTDGSHEIGRFTATGNLASDYTLIVADLPGSIGHNGGNIAFGPDGKLYYTMGDNESPENAQDPSTYPGKIHRFNDDGSIPEDNPYSGGLLSRYCMGLRNSFDMCWNTELGLLYASENGSVGNDEVNGVHPGGNYGWPAEACTGSEHQAPITCWNPGIVPTGIVAFEGFSFGNEYRHDLFVGGFMDGQIWRLDMAEDGMELHTREIFHDAGGALLDVTVGPDGALYYSTMNSIMRIRRDNLVLAPTSLACAEMGGSSYLAWSNQGSQPGGDYDQLEVYFDGELLALLPGSANGYLHLAPPSGEHSYTVLGVEGGVSGEPTVCEVSVSWVVPYVRGDCNGDAVINVGDANQVMNFLQGNSGVPDCQDACDMNNDEAIDLADAIAILLYLFNDGPGSPTCVDDLEQGLSCELPLSCP
ncbi:MAG: PQQ-dependent sugar dehydrogenase [Planctomycetota bacterium]